MKKVYCEHCKKDISDIVDKCFENFEGGRLNCPECGRRAKRYISETDLLLYFSFSAVLYFVVVSVVALAFNYVDLSFNPFTMGDLLLLLLVIVALAGGYVVFKSIGRYIYTKAPFKAELKNFGLQEDLEAVQKRLRWQFIAFMLVGLMLAGNPEYAIPYFIMIICFIIIMLIKVRLSLKNEQNHKGNG